VPDEAVERQRKRLKELQHEAENGKQIVEAARDRNRAWNIFFLLLGLLSGVVAGVFAVIAGVSEASWPGVVAGIAGVVAAAVVTVEANFKFGAKTTHNSEKGAEYGHAAGKSQECTSARAQCGRAWANRG